MTTPDDYQPTSEEKRRLLTRFYDAGLKSYDDQRTLCARILETLAGIQCYDHETLDDLAAAVLVNIEDGTLPEDCIETFAGREDL